MLNIGCGEIPLDGYVNIDKRKETNPDIICEIGKEKIPIDDNKVDYIFADNSLEHFENLISSINDLARISKDGAIWEIIVPYCTSTKYNLVNPYHLNPFFSEDTFRFWDDIYKREQPKGFKLITKKTSFKYNTDLWGENPPEPWEIMRQKYLNVVSELHLTIEVKK